MHGGLPFFGPSMLVYGLVGLGILVSGVFARCRGRFRNGTPSRSESGGTGAATGVGDGAGSGPAGRSGCRSGRRQEQRGSEPACPVV
ncbi:hypothetical protein GCM10009863_30120 [Streptomyces axinellae]|uniref:Uncharacterized protein n=1 Tax=Streptomyces axinellae TaxID=552788 RepID=A0ABN3Q340_9ACTN